jgi:tetratricopeptide (TPR) repeat protein
MSTPTNRGTVLSVTAALIFLLIFTTILDSAYRATRQNRADDRYHAGLELAAHGKYAEAVQEFSAALTYSHGDPRYRLALVRSLIELGRWSEAEVHLQELAEDDPTDGEVNLMRARLAARDGRDKDAITYYNRAIYGYWPENADQSRIAARFELIGILDRIHQQKRVLAELLQLADEVPANDVPDRLRIARLLLSHGSPDHAADVFKSVLAAAPKDLAALEGMGDADFALGDFRSARSYWRAAFRQQPGNSTLEQEIQTCEQVLDLDPTQVHLSAAARFDRAQDLLQRVLAAAQQCTALNPDLLTSAQTALAKKVRRRQDGDTLAMLSLGQQIWQVRESCSNQTKRDPVLSAIMAKVQKQ